MGTDLVPSKAFDFSKYQPGDVIVIGSMELLEHKLQLDDFVGMLMEHCRRHGIEWRMEHDYCRDEIRITVY